MKIVYTYSVSDVCAGVSDFHQEQRSFKSSGCSVNIYTKGVLFSFDFEFHKARLLWVALCQPRVETGWLVIDVSDTLPAHSGLVFGLATQWWSVGLMIERAGVPIPAGAVAEFLVQGPFFVLTLILVCVPPPCYRSFCQKCR